MSVDEFFDGLCPHCNVRIRSAVTPSRDRMPMTGYDQIPGRLHFCVPVSYRIEQQLAEIKKQAGRGRR